MDIQNDVYRHSYRLLHNRFGKGISTGVIVNVVRGTLVDEYRKRNL
jgi:hypothetical protein